MSIRYLWEKDRFEKGDNKDMFIVIPEAFMYLLDNYEVSEIIAFQLAHLKLGSNYNSNHTVFTKSNLGNITNEDFKNMILKKRSNEYEPLSSNVNLLIEGNRFPIDKTFDEMIEFLNLKKK